MTLHEQFMQRAILLGHRGLGRTWPNPAVGAVIVKKGKMIAEGFHAQAGGPHAEIVALRKAGRRARGADLYVTLEPCCHWGKTPPCTEAIIAAGIKRVVVGVRDPFPAVSGKGIAYLRRAGIAVHAGACRDECRTLIRPFAHRLRHGIPWVTLKVALSLDGKIATGNGASQWITGASCRRYVHLLRERADAILVGIGTVKQDDPRLTVRRGQREKKKLAIVVDSRLTLPRSSRLWRRQPGTLIIATTNRAPLSKINEAKRRGHEVLVCRATTRGRVFVPHLLHRLGARGISSLLVEGGGEIFSDFFSHNVAHYLIACVAPIFLGGKGRDFIPGGDTQRLSLAPRLKQVSVQRLGDDVVIAGELR